MTTYTLRIPNRGPLHHKQSEVKVAFALARTHGAVTAYTDPDAAPRSTMPRGRFAVDVKECYGAEVGRGRSTVEQSGKFLLRVVLLTDNWLRYRELRINP